MAISVNEKKVLDRAARILYQENQTGDVLSSLAQVREFFTFSSRGIRARRVFNDRPY